MPRSPPGCNFGFKGEKVMFARYILIGVIFLFFSVAAQSAERPQISSDHSGSTSHSHGAESSPLTATRADSVVLIGPWSSGALVNGQFQNQMGVAAWNGWTHRDLTEHEGDPLADQHLPGVQSGAGTVSRKPGALVW